ncbi:MAG: Rieske (2Fe-2S) protein [Candidatus Kapabacteria bacterium]|nr:Rieske (2Fe-2S) protein [Candidatus Kapabacteria bacterium]
MSTQSRRNFLRQATASVGLVLSAPVIAGIVSGCEKDESDPTSPTGQTFPIDITKISELSAIGSISLQAVTDLNGGEPVFISRIGASTFAVFSSVCTHDGCPVDLPSSTAANCICPCHKAEFSRTDGSVLRQPLVGSATNLKRFSATFDDQTGILTVRT